MKQSRLSATFRGSFSISKPLARIWSKMSKCSSLRAKTPRTARQIGGQAIPSSATKWANRCGKAVEIDLHGVRRNLGQDQSEGVIAAGLYGSIEIGEGVALIAPARRALAFCEPAVADAALLANARLILKKQADFLARMGLAHLFQAFLEPPLKASCAASSFSGWWGRAFCREKPSRLMATDMDQG